MLGPRLSIQVRYIVAALIMAVGLVSVVWLLFANVGRAVALAPQYQDSLLNSIQNLAVTLGLESEPSWKSLRQQFLAQVSIQRLVGGTLGSVLSIGHPDRGVPVRGFPAGGAALVCGQDQEHFR